MPGHLWHQVIKVEELVFSLKESQPEDDIIAVCDGDTETLEQMFDEVGTSVAGDSLSSGIIGGQWETNMNLNKRNIHNSGIVEPLCTFYDH